VGNRTIGSSALGGMLIGTVFGVIVIPGLYYLFGKLIEGRRLIKDEQDEPWSEEYVHTMEEQDRLLQKMHKERKASANKNQQSEDQ